MKRTTLALDERILARIRQKSRDQGRTLQECANELLWLGLEADKKGTKRHELLPVFSLGTCMVDITDREALYDLMESDEH